MSDCIKMSCTACSDVCVRISFGFPDANWEMLLLAPLELWGSGMLLCPGWGFPNPAHVDEICVLKAPLFLEADFLSGGAQVGGWGRTRMWSCSSPACRAPQGSHHQGSTPGAHAGSRCSHCDLFLPTIKNAAVISQFSREFEHTKFPYAGTSENIMRGI